MELMCLQRIFRYQSCISLLSTGSSFTYYLHNRYLNFNWSRIQNRDRVLQRVVKVSPYRARLLRSSAIHERAEPDHALCSHSFQGSCLLRPHPPLLDSARGLGPLSRPRVPPAGQGVPLHGPAAAHRPRAAAEGHAGGAGPLPRHAAMEPPREPAGGVGQVAGVRCQRAVAAGGVGGIRGRHRGADAAHRRGCSTS